MARDAVDAAADQAARLRQPEHGEATINELLRRDGIDYILAQWVDIHGTPRVKGVPASALHAFLGGSAGFAGAATVGMGQGPHSHDMIGMPDFASYTIVPWETGRRPGRVRHPRGRRGRGRTARGPCSSAPSSAWPAIGYEMRVGVEAEHMLVTRRPDGILAPVRPAGRRHPREALLRLQGALGKPRLPARRSSARWSSWAGSRTRPTTRTAPRSSS